MCCLVATPVHYVWSGTFLPKKRPPFFPLTPILIWGLPCMPRYLFFERKNAQLWGGGAKDRCCFIVHFLRRAVSSTYMASTAWPNCLQSFQITKLNMVQYLKRYSLNCFLPRVIVGRALSINVPSGGIPFVPEVALCQNSSCFHFILGYLRSLSSNHNVSSLFCVFFLVCFIFKHWKVAYH